MPWDRCASARAVHSAARNAAEDVELFSVSYGRSVFFFFFQAEDGIRDRDVTGVQTCALPISSACCAAGESPCASSTVVQWVVANATPPDWPAIAGPIAVRDRKSVV